MSAFRKPRSVSYTHLDVYKRQGLEVVGAHLDLKKNEVRGEDADLSKFDSDVAIWTILTNEELMIARETKKLFAVKQ